MSDTVTFRLDQETARILSELTRRERFSRSRVIKDALRAHWNNQAQGTPRTAWQVYEGLGIEPGRARHNRARRVKHLLKRKLLAKRRDGTL